MDGDLWSVPVPNRRLSACPAPDGLGVGSSALAGSKQNPIFFFYSAPTYTSSGAAFCYDLLKMKENASVAAFIDILAWCQVRLMDKPRTSDASATINEMYARDFTSETDKFDEAICNGFLEHGRKYQLRR